jgi:homoserine dehydrogenase
MVSPFLVEPGKPLYNVNGAFNAIFIHGNAIGDTMLYGSGAGKLPTASAVVADVISSVMGRGETRLINWTHEKLAVDGIGSDKRSFLVRVAADKLERAKEVFGSDRVICLDGCETEAALVTSVMSEDDFENKAGEVGIIGRIRIR